MTTTRFFGMVQKEKQENSPSMCFLQSLSPPVSYIAQDIHFIVLSNKFITSDNIIGFLEKKSPPYEFEYSYVNRKNSKISLGYEIKSVDKINAIYLMINPNPKIIAQIPSNSLLITHHKISCYDNRVYRGMLDLAQKNQFNIYNFHLAWDVMEGGIGDSFLYQLGLKPFEFEKIDLNYKENTVRGLGAILKEKYNLGEITSKLQKANVKPSVIFNKHCKPSKIGYIPGGGFVDSMIIEMADNGVEILISSDHNWTDETIARELGITLISIDHYSSERFGLHTMRNILISKFPAVPTTILENMDSFQCSCPKCYCYKPK
ncbi:MAG: Nif3-like dinuclear metal center hexameric protein [Candidatus Hodarchaeales archaeon]|jgi:putative NIF3 family GTP cyclohydrolase 1 type 2